MNDVMLEAFIDEMEKIAYAWPLGSAGAGLYARHKYDPKGETGLTGPAYGALYGLGGATAGGILGAAAGGRAGSIVGGTAGDILAGYYGGKHHIKEQQKLMKKKFEKALRQKQKESK